jgi:hypothetical protein
MPLPIVGKVRAVPSLTLSGLVNMEPCIYPPSNLVESKEGKSISLRNLLLFMAKADILILNFGFFMSQ